MASYPSQFRGFSRNARLLLVTTFCMGLSMATSGLFLVVTITGAAGALGVALTGAPTGLLAFTALNLGAGQVIPYLDIYISTRFGVRFEALGAVFALGALGTTLATLALVVRTAPVGAAEPLEAAAPVAQGIAGSSKKSATTPSDPQR